jgi:nucleoside-diphosphate-sugar epimerase
MAEKIFLTGFPGFIAERLVHRLAEKGHAFHLLVQPALADKAREDVAWLEANAGIPSERLNLIEGDITQPDLGMDASDLERVRAECGYLFHLAAIYDLAVERDLAMRVNVEGTRNVNSFARGMPALRRYHYVSTCYVAGKRTGLIREGELEHSAGFRNYYEETKHLAELEVERLKSELPITIHRPSVVCGDSQTGETAKYDGIYYLILYLLKQPSLLSLVNIGNDQVRLNLVPVDFVVEAMAALLDDEAALGATLQIADPDPLSTRELFEEISKVLTGRGSKITAPVALVRSTLSIPVSPPATGLPLAGVPYFFLDQTYDTSVSTRLLAPHGIACPRFPDYVGNLVNFVKEHPAL